MKIAAIDYGLSCGLAIAKVTITKDFCFLEKIHLETCLDDLPRIYNVLKAVGPHSVVLEACPYRAAGHSLKLYEHAFAMLKNQLGYQNGKDILVRNELVTIGPGLWKPFVKKQNLDYSKWNPKSVHEKDAMSLLWYVLKVQTKKEQIEFRERI